MNDAPRRTLRELIARRGPGLCGDARRCEGLLRDLCGGHRREVNLLVGALRERVPLDLLAGRNSVSAGLLLTRLAKRLEESLALTKEASHWAVDSWALALGIVTDAELEGVLKSREADAVRDAEATTKPAPSSARPAGGEGSKANKTTARPNSPQPPTGQNRQPPAAPTRPVAAGARATQTATRGGASAAAPHMSATTAGPPAHLQPADAGGMQAPDVDSVPRPGRRRSRRGCVAGCVLLLLLLGILAGAPFVINLLREEQLQSSPGAAPGQTR